MASRNPVVCSILAVLVVACSSTPPTTGPRTSAPTAPPNAIVRSMIDITVIHTDVGDALAGPDGMTLYVRPTELDGISTCWTDPCAERWPALKGRAAQVQGGDGVAGSFGTATWPDGTVQVTHNGQPLYYYSKDTAIGDATGQKPDGKWLVAPAGDASACPGITDQPQAQGSPFVAPGPAIHASENSDGEY